MRVLLLNPEYPPIGGGAGNASRHLARALAARGHQVTVLTAYYPGLPPQQVDDGVEVRRIRTGRRRADRSTPWEQAGFLLVAWAATVRHVRRHRPQVLLAFFGLPSGAVAWLLPPGLRVPYVVALRGGDVPGFRPYDFALYHRLTAPLLRRVWRGAAAVVANSRGLQALAQQFLPQVPIQVIPNGVDPQRFAPPPSRAWSPPHLLFVGRVVYQKGLDVLLHALAQHRERPWRLTIVGDGPYRPHLQALAQRLNLAERLDWAGWQPPTRIPAFYARANLFVFPSRDEGMPNAVLEALASGLPVVATRIAGNEELVTPACGRLVPREDPQALAAALEELLGDARLRQHLGRVARQRVLQGFTWDVVAQRYEALLQQVAAREPSRN